MATSNFHKIKKIAANSLLTKVKGGYVWEDGQFKRVWSGASEVSYYDGNILLGTEEVDEGEDVLHPSFSTTKSGYTLYGWALSSTATERITSLVATGEPMRLYAIYLPNTVTVASGTIWDTKYVGGTRSLSLRRTWSSEEATVVFNLNMGRYQSGTITVGATFQAHDTGNLLTGRARLDGVTFLEGDAGAGRTSASRTIAATNGNHSLYLYVISYDNYQQEGYIGVSNIVLSNPIAWT